MSEPISTGQLAWRIAQLEKAMEETEREMDRRFTELGRKLDRLMFAVLAAALTIAASAVVFTITYISTNGNG